MAAAPEASVLGNRELFGRLATTAMLPAMVDVVGSWAPDLILRDPCEYASAVVAHTARARAVQVAIGLAAVEWASIDVAAPGAAFGSLAAGVPVVIVPLFADQFANAAAIVGAGAGLAVESRGGEDGERPLGGDAVHRIAEAIDAVRADPAFREVARRVAGEMRRAPEATDLLDELLGRS